jgi:hypothetical protein
VNPPNRRFASRNRIASVQRVLPQLCGTFDVHLWQIRLTETPPARRQIHFHPSVPEVKSTKNELVVKYPTPTMLWAAEFGCTVVAVASEPAPAV